MFLVFGGLFLVLFLVLVWVFFFLNGKSHILIEEKNKEKKKEKAFLVHRPYPS